MATTILPVFQLWKLRFREVNQLVQDLTNISSTWDWVRSQTSMINRFVVVVVLSFFDNQVLISILYDNTILITFKIRSGGRQV